MVFVITAPILKAHEPDGRYSAPFHQHLSTIGSLVRSIRANRAHHLILSQASRD